MSSYKNTFQSIKPTTNHKYLGRFGQVIKVNTSTENLDLEGTISAVTSNGNILTNIYPKHYNIQQLPLLGELVEISKDDFEGRSYYSSPVNIHNFPTHNSPNESVITTSDYIEPTTVNPYRIYTGDTILQGRFGQSIRFSQTIENKTVWEGSTSNPVTIISNGQTPTEDGAFLLTEDINQDAATLYLVEDTKLPLIDLSKRDSYNQPIESGNEFRGNQAIIASDRLYLNARQDSVLVSAQSGSVGLSGETINIDGISSIRLDAPSYDLNSDTFVATNQERNINSETSTYNFTQFDINGTNVNVNYSRIGLGENAAEPVLQSTEFLTDIAALNLGLTQLATALTGVVGILAVLPGGQVPAAALQAAATTVISQANNIQTKAVSGNYLSTTVFTK